MQKVKVLDNCNHPSCEFPKFLHERAWMFSKEGIKPVPYCPECVIQHKLEVVYVPSFVLERKGIK